jgi:uncharacterized protein with beta-barrel porin domain
MPQTDNTLESLLRSATDIEAMLRHLTDDQYAADAADRLRDRVIRPLREAVPPLPTGQNTSTPDGASGNWAEELWELTRAATELRSGPDETPELQQAAAALQDLALGLADAAQVEFHRAEFAQMQAGLDGRIQVAANGPYLMTNARTVDSWLGERLRRAPADGLSDCRRLEPLSSVQAERWRVPH